MRYFPAFLPFAILVMGWQFTALEKIDEKDAPGEVSHFQGPLQCFVWYGGDGQCGGGSGCHHAGWAGSHLLDVGVCTPWNGHQVLYLFACGDVPGKGREWSGAGRADVFHPRRAGEKWKPLAIFFAACGMFGCLPLLQSNQLTQIVNTMFFEPQGWFVGSDNTAQVGECPVWSFTCRACWHGGSRRYQTNWCLCRTALFPE